MKKFFIKLLIILSIILITVVILAGCKYRWFISRGVIDIESISFNQEINQNYNFQWSSSENDYLKKLYEELGLKNIIRGKETELEKILALTDWTHNLWSHDGNNQPKMNDPISIYRESIDKNRNFRCVEYAIVLSGSLNALDFPSRVLALKTKDVETRKSGAGHVVTETYCKDFNKWIFIDPQWNAIPFLNNIPLNAVEFQKALIDNRDDLVIPGFNNRTMATYFNWISGYLYYFDTNLDQRYVNNSLPQKLMLVPVGANEPEVFQQQYPITNMFYTNSINEFYPIPELITEHN